MAFPYRLHRGDPMWVAPLRMDIYKLLDREKNPFFQHGKAEYYLMPPFGNEGHFFIGSPDAIPIWSPLVAKFLDERR